jgi:hypothetical protein
MTEPLLTELEAASDVDLDLLDRASSGVVAELIDPYGDAERYASTVSALARVPDASRWLLDLVVAAEMLANDQVMREPAGFRCRQ